jgi:hypothetical protein
MNQVGMDKATALMISLELSRYCGDLHRSANDEYELVRVKTSVRMTQAKCHETS